jgi:HAD superfamily hydrolase (TIGR01549 family)
MPEAARKTGIRLAVLSDYPAEEKLRSMGLRQYFEMVACAQDDGVRAFKPDPSGLKHILDRLGVPASRAAYIGDRPEVDGELARRAGVRGVIIGCRGDRSGEGWLGARNFREVQLLFGLI